MKQKTIITELFADIEKFGWKVVQDKINFYLKKEEEQIETAVTYGNRMEFYDGSETAGKQYYKETYD